MLTQAKFFIGEEAEGPLQGNRTLFIRGDVDVLPNNIHAVVVENKIKQLYLGAANIRGTTKEVLNMLLSSASELPCMWITFECDHPEQVARIRPYLPELERYHAVKIVFVVLTPAVEEGVARHITDIKFVGPTTVVWYSIEDHWTTALDDDRYNKDKEVLM